MDGKPYSVYIGDRVSQAPIAGSMGGQGRRDTLSGCRRWYSPAELDVVSSSNRSQIVGVKECLRAVGARRSVVIEQDVG